MCRRKYDEIIDRGLLRGDSNRVRNVTYRPICGIGYRPGRPAKGGRLRRIAVGDYISVALYRSPVGPESTDALDIVAVEQFGNWIREFVSNDFDQELIYPATRSSGTQSVKGVRERPDTAG